ncbi:glycosyl transferase [Rhizobium sp. R634]|uniref:glycosyltransferase family 2 protein n=1 Tax=Rhizobium sp. R634 TaxID=1764274 RepID=UPI000B534A07|nr:glycosyltransferase family 2 protein [Rhizobium sp. R634]OWV75516.1 glycosyl transferase [Rhizobium sp. R634]
MESIGATPHLQPLVSVVVPAFNASPFIERTLASATSQTYRALEIIVVDDGSTDDTARLVERVAANDQRIRLLRTANRGVAAARNTGIEAASGAYVAFLDADDLWHPAKIEKQVGALDRLPDQWAAVYVLHHFINRDDELNGLGPSFFARGYIYARHLTFKYIGNGSSLLVRRQAALEIGGFDSSYAAAGIGGCEDLDFELRLAARYCIEYVPERLLGYRKYPGNMSSNYVRMASALSEVTRRSLAAGPQLSSYAIRSAILAAHKYAVNQYILAGNYRLAAASARAVLKADPGFLIRLILRSSAGYAKRKLLLAIIGRERLARPCSKPRFQDLASASRPEMPKSPRMRRRAARLAETDAALSSAHAVPVREKAALESRV